MQVCWGGFPGEGGIVRGCPMATYSSVCYGRDPVGPVQSREPMAGTLELGGSMVYPYF